MNKIKAILEADVDGTLHLPVPPEMRSGKVEVTATLRPVGDPAGGRASVLAIAQRNAALARLRELGGLRNVIPDPAAWQRELRADRPLPGRE